jgi:hypothetical protein
MTKRLQKHVSTCSLDVRQQNGSGDFDSQSYVMKAG